MSPVPEVNQPDPADKAECSSGSDLTEESINLQDFVVVPSQISSPGSSTESHENEDLECYSDAQLKAMLDDAITYKTPKGQEEEKPAAKVAEELKKCENLEVSGSEENSRKTPKDEDQKPQVLSQKKDEGPKKQEAPIKSPFVRVADTWDSKTFSGSRDYGFGPKSAHPFGMMDFNRTSGINLGQDFAAYRPRIMRNMPGNENIPENMSKGLGSGGYQRPEFVHEVKVKKERNAIVRNSHEIDGYRGSDNIDNLVKFIESTDSAPPGGPKKFSKGGKPTKNPGGKKAKKAPQKIKQQPKPKEILKEVTQTVKAPAEQLSDVQEVKVSSGRASGSTSPSIETSDFRVVMKKKKKPKN